MADIYDRAKRASIMSSVRSGGNRSTELRLIEIFREFAITGWRRNHVLPGRPDFIFRRERLAVFVDGCFWHACPLHASQPATNASFWERKLQANLIRDREANRRLRARGWRVVRIWQHELSRTNQARLISRLRRSLTLSNRTRKPE
jgi:DNA mismatch endonuclease (patch repair protein)